VVFNRAFVDHSPNALADLLPEDRAWEDCVRVVEVPANHHGQVIELVMDGNSGEALAYLRSPGE